MSLTFILILLLVIGIVFANIALLRFGSKPMPVKSKKTAHPADTTATQGKTQAATTSAFPVVTPALADPSTTPTASDKTTSADSNDAAGD